MKLSCIGLLIATFSHGADRVWVRRITLGAACGASLGFDTFTTRTAVTAGAVESNWLLANSQGQPSWGRVIGIKAGICAASAFFEERAKPSRQSDWIFTGVNIGVTAGYTWVGFHNLRLANDLSNR